MQKQYSIRRNGLRSNHNRTILAVGVIANTKDANCSLVADIDVIFAFNCIISSLHKCLFAILHDNVRANRRTRVNRTLIINEFKILQGLRSDRHFDCLRINDTSVVAIHLVIHRIALGFYGGGDFSTEGFSIEAIKQCAEIGLACSHEILR